MFPNTTTRGTRGASREGGSDGDLGLAILEHFSRQEFLQLLDETKEQALGTTSPAQKALAKELDTAQIRSLRNRHSGADALIFGNGWRLPRVRGWRPAEGVVTIGTNFSNKIIESDYLAYLDDASAPPPSYPGVVFGRDRPGSIGAARTEYWQAHGRISRVGTVYTGLYAIEIAVFLGCTRIYLVGFDGDNSPRGLRHFRGRPEGGTAGRILADRQNEWLRSARQNLAGRRPRVRILGVLFGPDLPAIQALDGFVRAEDCPALKRQGRTR